MPKKDDAVDSLLEAGRQFYDRRWMWGTAGNLSLKVKQQPLEIDITPSGLHKGTLSSGDLLRIRDGEKQKPHPNGLMPSTETLIHQAIHRELPGCKAVFHVHAMYATLISREHGHPTERRYFSVEWLEMMKGVGVNENEKAEIAIFPNWQDVSRVADDVADYLRNYKGKIIPVVLLYNHGMTAWGSTPDKARDHLEIMEYVCQYWFLRHAKKS